MSEFNFDEWWSEFWNTYPNKKPLCYKNYGKGSQEDAKKKAKSKIKTQEKADKVLLGLREQIKFARYEIDSGIDKHLVFPMVSTWLNQSRWDIEIGSYTEVNEKSNFNAPKECSVTNCNELAHGKRFDKCARHLTVTDEFKKRVKDDLIKRGLAKLKTETMDEWKQRQLNYIKENFGKIGV